MTAQLDCAFCFKRIEKGQEVRAVQGNRGELHSQTHFYPDGATYKNISIPNFCEESHVDPHIHESCLLAWCDKFNMLVPEPFEAGDWDRLMADLKGK